MWLGHIGPHFFVWLYAPFCANQPPVCLVRYEYAQYVAFTIVKMYPGYGFSRLSVTHLQGKLRVEHVKNNVLFITLNENFSAL